jgi:hypothetical protein
LPDQDEPAGEDAAALRAFVAGRSSALRECSSDHGRALLALDVTEAGRVEKAELLARDTVGQGAADCIIARARDWKVPVTAANRVLVNLAF